MLCGSDCNDKRLRDVTEVKRGETVGVCDELGNGEEIGYDSARFYALQSVRN
jgi:hypothetical protein